MPVKREGKLEKTIKMLEAGQQRGLIQAGMLVAQRATQKAPRDTGRLKRSITHDKPEQLARLRYKIDIGTNVEYAAPMEYGTGWLSQAPDSKGKRHFPPPSALDVWAKSHGFASGWIVARAIWKRGGIAPRPYLRPALDESTVEIRRLILSNLFSALSSSPLRV